MKYFSINYWIKIYLLNLAFFDQQNKNTYIYGLQLVPKTTNNSLMLNLLTNETIEVKQLLNEKQNDLLSVFTFNENKFNENKKQVKLISPNLLKIDEMSKNQIQPFIKEQDKNIINKRFKRHLSSIIKNKGKINEIMPKLIPQLELSRIKSLTKSKLQLFTKQQIPYFTTEQIQAFWPVQVSQFLVAQIPYFTTEQIKALTIAQIKALTTQQIQALTTQQIKVFWPEQIPALTTAQVSQFMVAQIPYLPNNKQIPYFTEKQIKVLTPAQIQALTPTQISKLTVEQIQTLTEKQIKNSQQLLLIKKQLVIFNATTIINEFDLQNQTVITKLNQQRSPKL